MKHIGVVITALVLLSITSLYAYDDGDFQVWNTETEDFKINDEAKIAFEQEFRWGGSAKEFYYQHYDMGFFYSLQKYLQVGGGYRHVLSKSKDKFLVENQPYVALTFFSQLAGFKYDDRSRLEYNHFDYKDDTWKYRNKLTVKAPWKFTALQIQPFAADEIFILFDDGQRLNENRASVGLAMDIIKNLKGEIYYMFRSVKSGTRWIDANVLGTKLKLAF